MTQISSIRRPLPQLACPVCGTMLQAGPGKIVKADNWLNCLRKCIDCKVGVSNAMSNPTIIFNDPRLNVPEEVRGGLLDALALAINVRNRENKRAKFGFSTSEDALTWTLFKYLSESGKLTQVLQRADLPIPEGVSRHEALLLWGVPIPLDRERNAAGWALRKSLELISDQLGEDPTSRTEPDVLIDFGDYGLFIIEVKHRSGTDLKKLEYAGWDRYYPADSLLLFAADLRASCCYELARNWRFGLELSAIPPRPFTLVNLGPDGLFHGQRNGKLVMFQTALQNSEPARFNTLTWHHFLGSDTEPPQWLLEYVQSRGYGI